LSDHLPLSPAVLNILTVLDEDEPQHGYGIIKAYTSLTGDEKGLLPGSLYTTLARLEEMNLIEEAPAPTADASGGPPRRYYRRTERGTQILGTELRRLDTLLNHARGTGLLGEAIS